MISLMFKILADAAPWRKTVTQDLPKDAKKAGSEAGKEFGQQMKSAIMSYIGAGAVLGALKDQATKAAEIMKEAAASRLGVEAFQELKAASDATGMSMEEIQKLAQQLPAEFEAMMKPIRESGKILSSEQIQELAQIKDVMIDAASAAGRLFSFVWKTGKVIASTVSAGAMAGAGAVASGLGGALGSDRLSQAGRFLTTTAEVSAEDMLNGGTAAPSGNPALAFSSAATQQKQFNDWWESVGGPEASRSGGSDATAAEIRSLHSTIRDRL